MTRALAHLALLAALGFGVLSHPWPGHAEPASASGETEAATPPTNDVGAVDFGDPSPSAVHAPSAFGRTYPPATQAARDWAWRRLGTRQWRCLDAIGHYESGWRVRARNPYSGAYGIFQAVPASKMRRFGSDYLTSAMTQTRFGIAYADSRYGSPCAAYNFWSRNGWW